MEIIALFLSLFNLKGFINILKKNIINICYYSDGIVNFSYLY